MHVCCNPYLLTVFYVPYVGVCNVCWCVMLSSVVVPIIMEFLERKPFYKVWSNFFLLKSLEYGSTYDETRCLSC